MFPKIDVEANQKHFKTTLGCWIIFGVIVFLAGLITVSAGGWVAMIIGIGLAFLHLVSRPTGPESVDKSVADIHSYARDAARRKLAVAPDDQEIPPIDVSGFLSNPISGGFIAQTRASSDAVRTSVVRVLIAYFGQDQMHIYTLTASLLDSNKFAETTVEFFYTDVVSLSTETTSAGTTLSLSTSDGSKYECPASDSTNLDSEVNVARELIRSKRV